jgi:hypothetical protein
MEKSTNSIPPLMERIGQCENGYSGLHEEINQRIFGLQQLIEERYEHQRELSNLYSGHTTDIEELGNRVANCIRDIIVIGQNSSEELQALQNQCDQRYQEVMSAKKTIDNLKQDYLQQNVTLQNIQNLYKECDEKIDGINEVLLEMTHLHTSVELLETGQQAFITGQEVDTKIKVEIEQLLYQHQAELANIHQQLAGTHTEYKTRISNCEGKLDTLTKKISQYDEQIANISSTLSSYNGVNDTIATLKTNIDNLENELGSVSGLPALVRSLGTEVVHVKEVYEKLAVVHEPNEELINILQNTKEYQIHLFIEHYRNIFQAADTDLLESTLTELRYRLVNEHEVNIKHIARFMRIIEEAIPNTLDRIQEHFRLIRSRVSMALAWYENGQNWREEDPYHNYRHFYDSEADSDLTYLVKLGASMYLTGEIMANREDNAIYTIGLWSGLLGQIDPIPLCGIPIIEQMFAAVNPDFMDNSLMRLRSFVQQLTECVLYKTDVVIQLIPVDDKLIEQFLNNHEFFKHKWASYSPIKKWALVADGIIHSDYGHWKGVNLSTGFVFVKEYNYLQTLLDWHLIHPEPPKSNEVLSRILYNDSQIIAEETTKIKGYLDSKQWVILT